MKSVQIRSFFWSVFSSNAGKYGPEKTPYLDTFHAVTTTTKATAVIAIVEFDYWFLHSEVGMGGRP